MLIASNVKFNNTPLEYSEEEKTKGRKRRYNEIELERKQLAEEEYNHEIHEQRYKRLMHLLNKSKFYSSFLVNKIEKGKDVKKKGKPFINNENVPPSNKRQKIASGKYNIQEYIFPEVSNEKKIFEFLSQFVISFK